MCDWYAFGGLTCGRRLETNSRDLAVVWRSYLERRRAHVLLSI